MKLARISFALVAGLALSSPSDARAECNCVAIAADVAAAIQAEVAKADGLYARGDFDGALALYARAYGASREAALLYAQGMAHWQLGAMAQAKASFEAYLAAGGSLVYRDQVEASLHAIGAGAGAGVVAGAGKVGRVGVGTLGGVGAVAGGVAGSAVGTVGGGVGMVGGVATDVKPKKIGRKAGIVLGVIAIAAIGAVGIHSIAAGISDDIELDPKFDLGVAIGGVAVGISAIYVSGLTATTGAVGAAGVPMCATLPAKQPIVAPVAMPGGGGLAAAMTF
jgi:hypothetical protein